MQAETYTNQVWCSAHPEVLAKGVRVIACFRLHEHWVPVCMTPNGHRLQVFTWDAATNSHGDLNELLERMGRALGFPEVMVSCQQRLFFTSHLCGALALAFLHHCIANTMLPTSHDDAVCVHGRFRHAFFAEVSRVQIVQRPWIWASGDLPVTPECDTSVLTTGPALQITQPSPTSEQVSGVDLTAYDVDFPPISFGFGRKGGLAHRCISAEERIQLIIEHGQAMGDDEIRFHVVDFLQRAELQPVAADPHLRGFAFLEPILLSTWDTVGKELCTRWCQAHPQIKHAQHQIVSAINVDDHWIPMWARAHADVLQIHLVDQFHGTFPLLKEIGETLRRELQFQSVVFHWVPWGFLQHDLCGALTVAFLGHIIVHDPLPQDTSDLSILHTNLRAAFVEALHADQCCRCPSVWGNGPGPLCRELASELLKHGVPEAEVESRAAQAIRATGNDKVQQALKQKQPWRQLKSLANHVRFQFLLPSELSEVVAANRGNPVGKKAKASNATRISRMPAAVDLDPQKLRVLDGVFRADQQIIPQIFAAADRTCCLGDCPYVSK